ncbi:MAG TPA: type II toxin-antitoxin system Phd/YefM family antitoxin [Verrucomicrobiae bacterium]|jgi:antitoxin (DNA-binding transcriptional repressor) of toxin-antitoxin stability system|nr:type II toxin-antitoxin system Phd/YefM family antitoxin [Verrucomicrobiae bacterium]
MKSASLAEARANLPELIRAVESGAEIEVLRRQKAMAKIVPSRTASKKQKWADHFSKLDKIFGGKPARGKPGSKIIIDGRR